ncbi:SAM-dependent methyltransferase [Streptomyces sp. MNU76]|uniref:DNA methyltransferase n=1 Tax=Streptomyces sp. MNU76 TaxID=2560026 RepID=UPI001E582F98|nr:DNA methyltransferase [Streptomyces sp. MNU76]MCC9708231.1 SAM-dependent methyltransferase [Streptomyces sp. MNU76]
MALAETLAPLHTEHADADDHRQIMRLAASRVATARGLAAPWPVDLPAQTIARVTKHLDDQADLASWDETQLGELREQFLDSEERSACGAWYTPPPLAHSLAGGALHTLLEHDPDHRPERILDTTVIDPACGGRVFLAFAARYLTAYSTELLKHYGAPAPEQDTLTATIAQSCVFGIDTDPIAVDLAKTACWLAANGVPPIDFLDDNIIHGNALNADLPPAVADRITHDAPLAIVGNPPYKDKARGTAPWIEQRRTKNPTPTDLLRPSLDDFRSPGQGRIEHHLSNLYVYFWRWALWRAFETRQHAAVVAFVSPSAWLISPAFNGMRSRMRATADDGWIIDLTPEGKRPPANSRIFPGVALPICAALFRRLAGPHPDQIAHVQHAQVTGSRDEKLDAVDRLLYEALLF